MNYPQLAVAELIDTYGDRLFRYCWSMLRSREMAQIALRGTLLAAQGHIAVLTGPQDPESFGPWLYSLARAECRQHVAVPAADADEAPGRAGQNPAGRNGADARLMAWHAAMSLEAAEFEALELASRHDMDPGLVLGRPAEEVLALLARARQRLERALGAEILVSRGSACPDLAGVLAGRAGPLTAGIRDRVLEHAAVCQACADKRPRNVSAARVFALLPAPALSPLTRAELLASCTGQRQAAVPVRPPWPVPPAPAQAPLASVRVLRSAGRRPRRVSRAGLLVAGAIASAVGIAAAFALAGSAGRSVAVGESGPATAVGAPAGPGLQTSGLGIAGPASPSVPSPAPAGLGSHRSRLSTPPPLVGTAGGRSQVLIAAATQPLPPAPAPAARNGAPGQPPGAGVGGTPASPRLSTASVNVGAGSVGQISLTAVGGAVSWGVGQGSAPLSFELPPSAPWLVQVSWTAPPHSSGRRRGRRLSLSVAVRPGALAVPSGSASPSPASSLRP